MTARLNALALAVALATTASATLASTPVVTSERLSVKIESFERIAISGDFGELLLVHSVDDRLGAHVLLLTRATEQTQPMPGEGRMERTALRALYYTKTGGAWTQEWEVKDWVDCPVKMTKASFFTDQVTVTDLNKDGIAEVTVPYTRFCAGEQESVKVILRQGPHKFALRGDAMVLRPGQQSFGGTFRTDKDLELPENAAFRAHVIKTWNQVYTHDYATRYSGPGVRGRDD